MSRPAVSHPKGCKTGTVSCLFSKKPLPVDENRDRKTRPADVDVSNEFAGVDDAAPKVYYPNPSAFFTGTLGPSYVRDVAQQLRIHLVPGVVQTPGSNQPNRGRMASPVKSRDISPLLPESHQLHGAQPARNRRIQTATTPSFVKSLQSPTGGRCCFSELHPDT